MQNEKLILRIILKFGYFNPPIERIKGDYKTEFAHH